MIVKDLVALLHFAEIITRRVISHAGPARPALRDEVGPRIRGRLLFHEPVTFHASDVVAVCDGRTLFSSSSARARARARRYRWVPITSTIMSMSARKRTEACGEDS